VLRDRQILSKDIRNFPLNLGLVNRRKDNSRKGAKGAKEEEQKSFLCGLGVLARKSLLKRSVEHFIGKNLSHVTGTDGLTGQ
jgi:hypothetical protein